jgi:hypothetical protein
MKTKYTRKLKVRIKANISTYYKISKKIKKWHSLFQKTAIIFNNISDLTKFFHVICTHATILVRSDRIPFFTLLVTYMFQINYIQFGFLVCLCVMHDVTTQQSKRTVQTNH